MPVEIKCRKIERPSKEMRWRWRWPHNSFPVAISPSTCTITKSCNCLYIFSIITCMGSLYPNETVVVFTYLSIPSLSVLQKVAREKLEMELLRSAWTNWPLVLGKPKNKDRIHNLVYFKQDEGSPEIENVYVFYCQEWFSQLTLSCDLI